MWNKIKTIISLPQLKDYLSNRLVNYSLLFLLVFLSLFFLLIIDIFPTGKFNLGEVSPQDIIAPQSVEFINEKATQETKKRAAAAVQVVYTLDTEAGILAENKILETFQYLQQIVIHKRLGNLDKVNLLKKKVPAALSQADLNYLLSLSPNALLQAEEVLRRSVLKIMEQGIRQGDLSQAREKLKKEIKKFGLADKTVKAVSALGEKALVPNLVSDWRQTAQLEQQAIAQVESVRALIKKGQVVLRKGDIISNQHLEILKALGIYKPKFDLSVVGNLLIVLLVILLVIGFLRESGRNDLLSPRQLLLASLIMLVILALSKWLGKTSVYLTPVAAGAMLIAILIDVQLAVFIAVLMSILVGFFTTSLYPAAVSLFTCLAAILLTRKVKKRWDLFTATIGIILANIISTLGVEFMQNASLQSLALNTSLAALSGLLSGIIAIGALPLLETIFSIITDFKLLELSSPAEPLLQKLMVEAPGTYHHSLIIANLSDSAARSVQGAPLLARVGAMYHDLGKTKRPYFFVENQLGGENPHDKLSPHLSSLIISSHIKDGVELARKAHLPPQVVDLIEQHHGSSLIRYFYHRALKDNEDNPVNEESFRYRHPKPRSKEAAVIMLADACEAAVRSLNSYSPLKIENTVQEVIKEILADGQLQDSELSFKDISEITRVFTKLLVALYHSRIEYPELPKDIEKVKSRPQPEKETDE